MTEHIYTERLSTGFTFQMRLIPGGVFDMGSPDTDEDAFTYETPQRLGVQVAPFYLASLQTTQALWKAVMGEKNNPSRYNGDRRPVDQVSWYDTQRLIKALNEQTITTRQTACLGEYRLPTEAEWEYAARGGSLSGDYKYAGSDKLKEVGWYELNSDNETHEVGLLMPNELGLYDMSGNVWEWCEDHWHDTYRDTRQDGQAWLIDDTDAARVLRGGSCFDVLRSCRIACRGTNTPEVNYHFIGFRLALSLSQ